MKAIIIQDHDVKALLDALKVDEASKTKRFEQQSPQQAYVVTEVYRAVHYIVISWAQEHGARIVP